MGLVITACTCLMQLMCQQQPSWQPQAAEAVHDSRAQPAAPTTSCRQQRHCQASTHAGQPSMQKKTTLTTTASISTPRPIHRACSANCSCQKCNNSSVQQQHRVCHDAMCQTDNTARQTLTCSLIQSSGGSFLIKLPTASRLARPAFATKPGSNPAANICACSCGQHQSPVVDRANINGGGFLINLPTGSRPARFSATKPGVFNQVGCQPPTPVPAPASRTRTGLSAEQTPHSSQ